MKTTLFYALAVCLVPFVLASCAQAKDEMTAPVEVKSEVSAETQSTLARIDALYEGVYPWLAKLYDPATGGFYASPATRGADGFGADIEDSTFALTFLRDDGLLETMPQDVRRKMIEFFQSRQDPKTGFFFDTHHRAVFEKERQRVRALRFAMEGLKMLDDKPLHPLPGARAVMPETAHLQSEAAFKKWLDARPWDKAWGALDEIYQQAALIKSLPDDQQKKFIAIADEYLKQKQDPESGLTGGGVLIVKIAGAAKLGWFLGEFDRPIPRADALANTTLQWYRSRPDVEAVTLVRNPIEHLADLQPFLEKPMIEADKQLALETTLRLLPRFRQKDGAFSMNVKEFYLGPFDWKAAKAPAPQGDVNGTAMAQKSRASAYRLAGLKAPSMAGADNFWEMVAKQK